MRAWWQWYLGKLGRELLRRGWGRDLGNPNRRFFKGWARELFDWISRQQEAGNDCFMSVQYLVGRGQPIACEKLYLDYDNKASDDPEPVKPSARAAIEMLRSYGVEPLVLFSGRRGYAIYAWFPFLLEPALYKPLIAVLSPPRENLDTAVLEPSRISRIPFTRHPKTGKLCQPLDLDFKPVDHLDLDHYVSHPFPAKAFRALVEAARTAKAGLEELEEPRRRPKQPRGVWRTAKVVFDDGSRAEIQYRSCLEGFGWAATIVKEMIPLSDGRMTFAWTVLPTLLRGPKTRNGRLPPMITEEEAKEWLRCSVEAHPDKDLSKYIEKLSRNKDYDYNIPTWTTLITGQVRDHSDEDHPVLDALRAHLRVILEALERAGYVKFTSSG